MEIYRGASVEHLDYVFDEHAAWCTARDLLGQRLPRESADVAVLDIGCHTGAFLASLPSRWRRYGVESAVDPVRLATERHRVTIVADRLQSVSEDWNGRFDAVTLFDVVEHLPDPAEGLARAGRLLKPGGLMLVSTGDMDAWTWKVLRGSHWYLQSPQHVSVASRAFFDFVARREGLGARMIRIPHRTGSVGERSREGAEVIYWGMRERGGAFRFPQRLLQAMPGLRYLRHQRAVPWAMRLRDHVVALFSASAEPNRPA